MKNGSMTKRYDVLIGGGGMAGLGLSIALAKAGFAVAVVDPKKEAGADAFDGRVTALTLRTQRLLANLCVWEAVAPHAEPIRQVLVTDAKPGLAPSPRQLRLDAAARGDDRPFGHIVENRHILAALGSAAAWAGVERIVGAIAALDPGTLEMRAVLENGEILGTLLAVAADGRASRLRGLMGIGAVTRDYHQTAIVVAIRHDKPHGGVACDHFLPAGPFAVLPMTGQRCSLVWSERPAHAQALLELPAAAFDAEIQQRVGNRLGQIHSEPQRWSYRLKLALAREFVGPRFALLGDAAHAIHPLAGQNFNLALEDAAALTEIVSEGVKVGLDPGDPSLLLRYRRRRRPADAAAGLAMDAIDRIFSNDIPPLRLARDLGLAAIDAIGPLRRCLMRVGD
jgi:2-octaprenyl-6-methoxyphenol hydroxylase